MHDRPPTQSGHSTLKRRGLLLFALLGAVAVGGIVTVVSLDWSAGPTVRANPDDLAQVSLGKTIYADNCASCHGANLAGQPDWRVHKEDGRLPAPPHDETGHTWHHPDEQLFQITKLGLKPPLAPDGYESDMPSFGGTLSDEQIWAVLAFIKSTWPEETRARRSLRDSAAKP
jgi:mono/diheme cytochrome c family protein